MARALIVGCGCRGRALGRRLGADGWSVRGTTRDPGSATEIEAAGIEPAIADPGRPGTLLELIGDVTVVHLLLGSVQGDREAIEAIHGRCLEALLERLVDTPVRGLVYEAAGSVPGQDLERGAAIMRSAAETWRIRVEVVGADPADHEAWLAALAAATQRLLA